MIYLRLAGGLGNQIFQLAAALLASKITKIHNICIDDSSLKHYDARRQNELSKFFDFDRSNVKIIIKDNFLLNLRLPKILPLKYSMYPFIGDDNFNVIWHKSNPKYLFLDGYFQMCLTQDLFNTEINIMKSIFNNISHYITDVCVIHIRGGDFVRLGWNSITPKEYYIKAMKYIKSISQIKKFHIITDDKNYSIELMQNVGFEYNFVGGNINEDFLLLGGYKYQILSSSTFAMWSSALCGLSEHIVIAPTHWAPNKRRNIYLPNEIRL